MNSMSFFVELWCGKCKGRKEHALVEFSDKTPDGTFECQFCGERKKVLKIVAPA